MREMRGMGEGGSLGSVGKERRKGMKESSEGGGRNEYERKQNSAQKQ